MALNKTRKPWRRLGLALLWVLCLALMGGAQPAVLHWVIIPSAHDSQRGWRVSLHEGRQPGGKALAYLHARETSLSLSQPNTCLEAWGLWKVPGAGRYFFKLASDDYARVHVDLQPVVWRDDPTPKVRLDFERDSIPGEHQHLEGWADLAPGLHLLRVRLANIMGSGRLALEVRMPGHADWRPLGGEQLIYLDRGNASDWLAGARVLAWLGLAGALVLLALFGRRLWRAWPGRESQAAAPPGPGPAALARAASRLSSLELLLDHRQEGDALLLAPSLLEDLARAAGEPAPSSLGQAQRLHQALTPAPGRELDREAMLELVYWCGQALDDLRAQAQPAPAAPLVAQVWLWLAAALATLIWAFPSLG